MITSDAKTLGKVNHRLSQLPGNRLSFGLAFAKFDQKRWIKRGAYGRPGEHLSVRRGRSRFVRENFRFSVTDAVAGLCRPREPVCFLLGETLESVGEVGIGNPSTRGT